MFVPQRVIFETNLYHLFKDQGKVDIIEAATNRIKSNIPGENLYDQYRHGKQTLVVGVKKSLKFQSCKPSAHYQLPLVSGCMGQCEY